MSKRNSVLEELSKTIADTGITPGNGARLTKKDTKALTQVFESVPDGRIVSKCDYPLHEVLLLAFLGVLGGCNTWVDLELYGKENIRWLKKFYRYRNGTPSHDEFRYIFGKIPNSQFQDLIIAFLTANITHIKHCLHLEDVSHHFAHHYAIDGKEENGTGRTYSASQQGKVPNQQTLHVWDIMDGLCLYSKHIESKTNEIPVAQEWLRAQKSLKNCLVTFDALHTQKVTWKLIQSKGGDSIGGLKGNQSGLLEDVSLCFDEDTLKEIKKEKKDYLKKVEKAHSQVETREYYRLDAYEDAERDKQWGTIRSFVCLIKTIQPTNPSKSTTVETRYYITTLTDVAECAEGIRAHWQCETGHWFLDTVFREDYNTTMDVNAYQNLSLMIKMVLFLLKLLKVLPQYKKASLNSIRKALSWNKEEVTAKLFSLLDKKTIEETLSGVTMTDADKKKAKKLLEEDQNEFCKDLKQEPNDFQIGCTPIQKHAITV